MHQEYLDSLDLHQCCGHPHDFTTMTCNPNCCEIQENLKDGETSMDRSDLVACVFKLKKQQLIRDLGIEMMFGMMIARTNSMEFQKRSFPHMHIIFWLEEGSHMTPKELDQFICAELPDKYLKEKHHTGKPMVDTEGKPIHKWDRNGKKVSNPLWTAVTSFMLHGPCRQHNPSLGCMVDGHSQFGYPKNYQTKTEISEDGYPQYHQCEDPYKVYKAFSHGKPYDYTNCDVVPYHKYLLYNMIETSM